MSYSIMQLTPKLFFQCPFLPGPADAHVDLHWQKRLVLFVDPLFIETADALSVCHTGKCSVCAVFCSPSSNRLTQYLTQ